MTLRVVPGAPELRRDAVAAMLEARRVAVVGASARPGSLGERLVTELARSPSAPELHLVNPRHDRVGGRPCVASLADVAGPVDLVALAVGDHALEEQLSLAAARGDRAAVIFASAFPPGLRERLAAIAAGAGMAVCGAGCMGFVNVAGGLRAVGYLEPDPLPSGPVALVTHSGSAFSALLRADRRLGWSLAVSSGQELVTTTADYVDYALDRPETRVVALLLETVRRPDALVASLHRAAEAGVATVALTVGSSPGGRALVQAHSGALAGDDGAWEALCRATGLIRVHDLAELVDTLELFAAGRRRRGAPVARRGIATVHDSGAERALAVDVARRTGTIFAAISPATEERLRGLLDDGLDAGNPLDVWGTGAGARKVLAGSLVALAEDPSVDAVALCVDLVPELDGDRSYEEAVLDAWSAVPTPLCVLSNLPSALDRAAARRLRDAGVPVLEGTASGLAALGHLAGHDRRLATARAARRRALGTRIDEARRSRWRSRLAAGPLRTLEAMELLAAYGIAAPVTVAVASSADLVAAGGIVGWPAVLKTDAPGVAHKSDVGGVAVGLAHPAALEAAYADMSARLGPEVVVAATAPEGVELSVGIVSDPLLGPLVVVGAGGVLVELLADRRVALPPLDRPSAAELVDGLRIRALLDGLRGGPAADLDAVADAVAAVSVLAVELGDHLTALDVNPLRCGPAGALALDVLVEVM